MKKEEIISVLSDWNFWGKGLEIGIKRETYVREIIETLEGKVNKVVTIFGVRRSGKSYILRQVAKILSERHGKENVLYVNFEEVKFGPRMDEALLVKIFEAFREIVRPSAKPFLILDEVQEVKNWERFVRSLHEKGACRFVVSGSSAKLMSEELSTLLAGRSVEVEVFPLSFKEYLKFVGVEYPSLSISREDLIAELRKYLEWGGFPEVVLSEKASQKRKILRGYFETILLKDVEKRFRIREREALEFLSHYYLTNISSLISFNRLSKFLKIPVKTVERFSKYLQTSRMIFFVNKFSFGLRERKISPRKVYSIDCGISNSIGFRFLENYGKLIENLVAVSLLRRLERPLTEIFYYKDYQQREVDFLIKEGLKIKQLIQVTYASSLDEIERREIKALTKAYDLFKKDRPELIIITWDLEDILKVNNKEIKLIPLWKWLLTK